MTSVRHGNNIRKRHLRDRFVTARLTSNLSVCNRGRAINRNTVRNRFVKQGLRWIRLYRVMILTERHRQLRRHWAVDYRASRWLIVILIDESRLNISNADGRLRVYRRCHLRNARNCVLILTICEGDHD